jgi:hypothetical protein
MLVFLQQLACVLVSRQISCCVCLDPAALRPAAAPKSFPVLLMQVDVPVEHGLLMENLLDLAHAPFTHTSTFAKGWPIPEAVRFHATKMLAGACMCAALQSCGSCKFNACQ